MSDRSSDRRVTLWICLAFGLLLAAFVVWKVPWRSLIAATLVGPLTPATPAELAAAQAAYDQFERNRSRASRFQHLTMELDRTGRGSMTEAQIVQSLGTPDGQQQSGTRRMIVYYYDRFGRGDWFALAEFNNGVLVHFGYNGTSQLPRRTLQPYVAPPTTAPATAPATPPSAAMNPC